MGHFQLRNTWEGCEDMWRLGRRRRKKKEKGGFVKSTVLSYALCFIVSFFLGVEDHLYWCWFWNVLSQTGPLFLSSGLTSPAAISISPFECLISIFNLASNIHTLSCAFKHCSNPDISNLIIFLPWVLQAIHFGLTLYSSLCITSHI